jgi:hypothetical protein
VVFFSKLSFFILFIEINLDEEKLSSGEKPKFVWMTIGG